MAINNHENNISFSVATPYDAPQVAGVLTQAAAWRTHEKGYNSWPIPFPQPELEQAIAATTLHVGRLASGKVASCLVIDRQDEPIWGTDKLDANAYIKRFAIDPQKHGNKIGSAMLNYASSVAKSQSKRALRLDCNHDNQPLCRYYEQQGFIYVGLTVTKTGYHGAKYERPIL